MKGISQEVDHCGNEAAGARGGLPYGSMRHSDVFPLKQFNNKRIMNAFSSAHNTSFNNRRHRN